MSPPTRSQQLGLVLALTALVILVLFRLW